jgi:kynureninase
LKFISLAVQRTRAYVDEVMDDWANLAVEGHFMLKSLGDYHERLAKPLGKIMGHCHLKLLNTLTVNLHLLMSFYRPTKRDTKSFVRKAFLLINTCFKV